MMLREMIRAGSFLYFLDKGTIICEDLTGQRTLGLGLISKEKKQKERLRH